MGLFVKINGIGLLKIWFFHVYMRVCKDGVWVEGERRDLRRQRPKAIYVRVYNGFAASMQN